MDDKQAKAVKMLATMIMQLGRADVDATVIDGALVFLMAEIYPEKNTAECRELLDFAIEAFPLILAEAN